MHPDGNNKDALKALLNKAIEWKDLVKAGHLKQATAWQAVETTILKSLEYPLPALTLTEKECNKLMRPILSVSLPKSSISQNYPRKVLYGPINEGGLGLDYLYYTQGAMHLEKLQCYLGTNSITGDLLRVSIETAQLEIGIGRSLFQLDYNTYEFLLTDCWIKHIWKFIQCNNILLIDRYTSFPTPQRENDLFLMEVFVNEGFPRHKLVKINKCRLYLGVLTLSDIMNGYGTGFTSAYKCDIDPTRISLYRWPRQTRPGSQCIKMWKSALRHTFGMRNGSTTYRLGKWFYRPTISWLWFYAPLTQTLYQRFGHVWRAWTRLYRRGTIGRWPKFRYDTNCINLPQATFCATVHYSTPQIVQLTGWQENYFHEEHLFTMQSTEEWILQNIDRDVNMNARLALFISSAQVIAVCDGSFYKEHSAGGAGWYIESTDQTITTSSSCVTPGPAHAQSSPRSKLMGVLSTIMHCNYICQRFGIQTGTITLYCDNEGVINSVQAKLDIIKNSRKNYDLLQSIHSALIRSPIQWIFHHIKGHQDELEDYDQLSRPSQLNVLADLKAKEAVHHALENNLLDQYRLYSLPYTRCEIRIIDSTGQHHQLHSHLQKSIKHHCSTTQIREFWINKHQLQHNVSRIDWHLKTTSHNNTIKPKNKWLSKHSTGFCGVGKMLVTYKFQTHSNCPRCGVSQETPSHVLQCPSESACLLWDKEIKKLQEWMNKNNFQPQMVKHIIHNLNAWKYRTPKLHTLPVHPILRKAITQQDQIGWKQFVLGFWAKTWRDCQTQHLKNINSPTSALLLLSKAQRRIWQIAWELWNQRNQHLHGEQHSIPEVEKQAINAEVTHEWNLDNSALPARHRHLFRSTLEHRLQKSYHSKRIWLASVWAARETIDTNYLENNPLQTDSTIRLRYDQWKRRRKLHIAQLQDDA